MMMLQGTYNFVDTYFVGYLGANALAGISTGGFILWMTFGLANLASAGIVAKVARRVGEGDRQEADRTAVRGLLYGGVLAVALAVPLYASLPVLFGFMQTTDAVTQMGLSYITPLTFGLPAIFITFVLTGVFNAAGDTRTPFILYAVSLLVNALLDVILIFGLGGMPTLGVAGAAWATVIARIMWIILALYELRHPHSLVQLRLHQRHRQLFHDFWEVIRIGAPKALTGVLFSGIYMALTRITSHYGTPNVAALRIGHIYEGFSFFTALGFSIAAATMVGQNLGAGQPKRAMRAAWAAGGIVFCVTSLVGVVFFFAGKQLAGVFSNDQTVVMAGATYLMILAWSQPFMGIEIAIEGGFSGAGNTIPPMLIQVPLTLLRYPAALLLCFYLDWGIAGVWWAISGSSIIKGCLMSWWFLQNKWMQTKV